MNVRPLHFFRFDAGRVAHHAQHLLARALGLLEASGNVGGVAVEALLRQIGAYLLRHFVRNRQMR